jgi:hypothetical protein
MMGIKKGFNTRFLCVYRGEGSIRCLVNVQYDRRFMRDSRKEL